MRNGVPRATVGKVMKESCNEGHQRTGSDTWQILQRATLRKFTGDHEATAGKTIQVKSTQMT